jgi:adenylate cyclase
VLINCSNTSLAGENWIYKKEFIVLDSKQSITIENIKKEFKEGSIVNNEKVSSFGYTTKKYAVKFSIENKLNTEIQKIILLRGPIEKAYLWHENKNDILIEPRQESGMYQFSIKENYRYRYPSFKVILPPGQNTFYILEDAVAPHFPILEFNEVAFNKFKSKEYIYLSLFFGAIFCLILAQFFISMSNIDNRGLHFFNLQFFFNLLLVFFTTGAGNVFSNYLIEIPGTNLFKLSLHFIDKNWILWWALVHIFSLLFLYEYTGRKLKKTLLFGLISAFFLSLGNWFFSVILIETFSTIYHFILIYFSFKIQREKSDDHITKNLVLFGIFIYLLTSTLTVLYFFGVISQSFITDWGLLIGFILQVVAFGGSIFSRNIFEKKSAFKQLSSSLNQLIERDSVISSYVSPEILSEFSRNLNPLSYEPRMVNCAIMFTDIKNYTNFSEQRNHFEIFNILNYYFKIIINEITSNGGEVNKLIGDSIMATSDSPDQLIKSVVRFMREIRVYNIESNSPLNFGVGIHYGTVLRGNFGAGAKLDRTLIGDVVNSSSRIEQLTRVFKTDILVSSVFYEKLTKKEFIRPIYRSKVKGKNETLDFYEVYGHLSETIRSIKESNKTHFEEIFNLAQNKNFAEINKLVDSVLTQKNQYDEYGKVIDLTLIALKRKVLEEAESLNNIDEKSTNIFIDRKKRIETDIIINITSKGQVLKGKSKIINLSLDGAFILTNRVFQMKESITLSLEYGKYNISISSIIMWVELEGYLGKEFKNGYGVEFIDLTKNEQEILKNILFTINTGVNE